jgi:hypothetical protein
MVTLFLFLLQISRMLVDSPWLLRRVYQNAATFRSRFSAAGAGRANFHSFQCCLCFFSGFSVHLMYYQFFLSLPCVYFFFLLGEI